MIRFTDRRVTNGRNHWTVSGTIEAQRVTLTQIYGDINDVTGLRAAVRAWIESRPRYRRALDSGARVR